MKILVTGATGRVGQFLVEQLHDAGHQVVALTRNLAKAHFPAGIEVVQGDLTQPSTIKAPTLVIHGTNDRVNMTANAPLLAERIPNAELYMIQNGRHAFHEEFREESTRVAMDFLAHHPLYG